MPRTTRKSRKPMKHARNPPTARMTAAGSAYEPGSIGKIICFSPVALRRRTVVGLVASIAGVALLVWQIRAAGPAAIADRLSQVGWWFVAILALSFGRLLLRSIAWR